MEEEEHQQICMALSKSSHSRSYDDLLFLRSYLAKTELMTKHLLGVADSLHMNEICKSMTLEKYKAGEVVFNQGDIGEKVYVILSGECEVKVKYNIDLTLGESEIREKVIVTYHTNNFFGERALQFHEPRSATVTCTNVTELIVVSKASYLSALHATKQTKSEGPKTNAQLDTKESVVQILSKSRVNRNNRELEAVASYLRRRIPFFSKFSGQQLIELCRVAESLSIWGRHILFKQGQIGQAFYLVLSGEVEVWVDETNSHAQQLKLLSEVASNNARAGNKRRLSVAEITASIEEKKSADLTNGLGKMVNQLVVGDQFGERALESESSMRMGSIITCDGLTELLVIPKADYHNLVYMMINENSMEKLSLLRKTELFRTADVLHLKSLARFMELKKYKIGQVLFQCQEKATEMIIIEKGECNAELEIEEGTEISHRMKYAQLNPDEDDVLPGLIESNDDDHSYELRKTELKAQRMKELATSRRKGNKQDEPVKRHHLPSKEVLPKLFDTTSVTSITPRKRSDFKLSHGNQLLSNVRMKVISLGRIAPNSVLAAAITQCESVHHDVCHTETVKARTPIIAYTVSKHDFFNHMPKDTRNVLVQLVNQFQMPIVTPLWEITPQLLDEDLYHKSKTWHKFKEDLVEKGIEKGMDILSASKIYSKTHLTKNSGNHLESKIARKNRSNMIKSTGSSASKLKKGVVVDKDWGSRETRDKTDEMDVINYSHGNRTTFSHITDINQYRFDALPRVSSPIEDMTLRNHRKADNVSNLIRQRINRSHTIAAQAKAVAQQQAHHFTLVAPEGFETSIPVNSIHQTKDDEDALGDVFESSERHRKSLQPHKAVEDTRIIDQTKQFLQDRTTLQKTNIIDTSGLSLSMSGSAMKDFEEVLFTQAADVPAVNSTRLPFSLIQLHREAIDSTDSGKRGAKCFFRLCGAMSSSAAAKDYADMQMECLFLTLFGSDATKECELLLNWVPFKSFDAIPFNSTDHFIVYCRGTPIECASINPFLSIFTSPFPNSCKLKGQRYACIVTNSLSLLDDQFHDDRPVSGSMNYLVDVGMAIENAVEKEMQRVRESRDGRRQSDDNSSSDSSSDEEKLMSNVRRAAVAKTKMRYAARFVTKELKKKENAFEKTSFDAEEAKLLQGFESTVRGNETEKTTVQQRGSVYPVITVGRRGSAIGSKSLMAAVANVLQSENASSYATDMKYNTTNPQKWIRNKLRKEFSVVNEVLMTTLSRVECLKYAIMRFGETRPRASEDNPPKMGSNPGSRFGARLDSFSSENSSTVDSALVSSKRLDAIVIAKNILFRDEAEKVETADELSKLPRSRLMIVVKNAGDALHNDRVLDLLINSNKRVCVIPLYTWILVSESNIEDFNFANAFSGKVPIDPNMDDEVENELSNSSYHLTFQRLGVAHEMKRNPDFANYRKDEIPSIQNSITQNVSVAGKNPTLVRSLVETGLIDRNSAMAASTLRGIDNRAIDWNNLGQKQTNASDFANESKEMILSKSLQLLEHHVSKTEIMKNIKRKVTGTSDANQKSSKNWTPNSTGFLQTKIAGESGNPDNKSRRDSAMSLLSLNTDIPFGNEKLRREDAVDSFGEDGASMNNNANAREDDDDSEALGNSLRLIGENDNDSIQLEHRLESLNSIAAAQRLVIDMHDKVCREEHLIAVQSHGFRKLGRVDPKADLRKSGRRMNKYIPPLDRTGVTSSFKPSQSSGVDGGDSRRASRASLSSSSSSTGSLMNAKSRFNHDFHSHFNRISVPVLTSQSVIKDAQNRGVGFITERLEIADALQTTDIIGTYKIDNESVAQNSKHPKGQSSVSNSNSVKFNLNVNKGFNVAAHNAEQRIRNNRKPLAEAFEALSTSFDFKS